MNRLLNLAVMNRKFKNSHLLSIACIIIIYFSMISMPNFAWAGWKCSDTCRDRPIHQQHLCAGWQGLNCKTSKKNTVFVEDKGKKIPNDKYLPRYVPPPKPTPVFKAPKPFPVIKAPPLPTVDKAKIRFLEEQARKKKEGMLNEQSLSNQNFNNKLDALNINTDRAIDNINQGIDYQKGRLSSEIDALDQQRRNFEINNPVDTKGLSKSLQDAKSVVQTSTAGIGTGALGKIKSPRRGTVSFDTGSNKTFGDRLNDAGSKIERGYKYYRDDIQGGIEHIGKQTRDLTEDAKDGGLYHREQAEDGVEYHKDKTVAAVKKINRGLDDKLDNPLFNVDQDDPVVPKTKCSVYPDPMKIAIFVNGNTDGSAWGMTEVQKTFCNLGITQYFTPWNSVSMISGSVSENQSAKVTVGATQNFINQMTTYFNSLPTGSEVYLIGHSFGGDSIYRFLNQWKRNKLIIKFVAVLDAVKAGGYRSHHQIPNRVEYFFNRWQENFAWPTDYWSTGKVSCKAVEQCDQEKQKYSRYADGSVRRRECSVGEFGCKGTGIKFQGINSSYKKGTKMTRLHHGYVPRDPYIQQQIIDIVSKIANPSYVSSIDENKQPSRIDGENYDCKANAKVCLLANPMGGCLKYSYNGVKLAKCRAGKVLTHENNNVLDIVNRYQTGLEDQIINGLSSLTGSSTIHASDGGQKGRWSLYHSCPENTWANGFRMKVQPLISSDNSALNNIQLSCSNKKGQYVVVAPADIWGWGQWGAWHKVPGNQLLTGYSLKIEPQKEGDNTAANDILFVKSDGQKLSSSNGGFRGTWQPNTLCPAGTAISAINVRIEKQQGQNDDDTALNDVKFICSPLVKFSRKSNSQLINVIEKINECAANIEDKNTAMYCRKQAKFDCNQLIAKKEICDNI